MSRTRDEFKGSLIDLVRLRLTSRRAAAAKGEIDGSTPLFETGLIDSMAVLELMAFIEEATGRSIPSRMVHMKHFGTIDRICASFWTEQNEVANAAR